MGIYGAILPLAAAGWALGGFQLAMALACSLAFALSWMPGKRRLSSMAADSSPSRS
jgi:hypothetical protein